MSFFKNRKKKEEKPLTLEEKLNNINSENIQLILEWGERVRQRYQSAIDHGLLDKKDESVKLSSALHKRKQDSFQKVTNLDISKEAFEIVAEHYFPEDQVILTGKESLDKKVSDYQK